MKGGDTMNQIKIGKFIAERRKQKNLTQLQLAEKLCITDKAISKWERGASMPDSSVMLELCEVLGISVNELLKGEKDCMENNERKNEQVLLDMAKELERKNKLTWISMWVILSVSLLAIIASAFIAKFLITDTTSQIILVIGTLVVFLPVCFFALKIEVSVGAYKCKNCGHEFVPTYKKALFAMHMGTTRYLKCPKCKKRTWCKKIINKE